MEKLICLAVVFVLVNGSFIAIIALLYEKFSKYGKYNKHFGE